MPMYVIWGILIVLFGILEGVTAQLVSIWFVIGGVGALIASFVGASIPIQIAIFIGLSIIALVITRPIVKKHLNTKVVSTNADRCIGKDAVVIQKIDNLAPSGQVKVDGSVWSAKSVDNTVIDVDTIVTVEKIEGVKLLVKLK